MEHTANHVHLCGALAELPRFSHENHDRRFYRFPLEVERLSGAVDILPVLVSEEVLCRMDLSGGQMLAVDGQIRTFNNRSQDGRRLVISVYAESLVSCDGEPENEVELTGTVCKEPIYRQTPLGREICDLMLAVNRPYHRADYIPCIAWGRTANLVRFCAVGTGLHLTGRFQSRAYVKVLGEISQKRTAYEVSVMTAEISEKI